MGTFLGFCADIFKALGWLEWLFMFMLAFVTFVVWRANRDPNSTINIEYLVVDPSTGSIVLEKFTMFGAFIISSWAFVALTAKDRLTEWYFIGYMAAWATTRGFTGWLASKKNETKT